jgi:tetratricopeptide (TPR) repeat protein
MMKANKATADKLLDKGNFFYDKEKWNHALECWERANEIYAELGDKLGISIILNNIGFVYQNRGEWVRALEYYEKSLSLTEELGDKQGISTALNNIGKVYQNRGEWVRALEYYEKSLTIFEELGDKQGVSTALNNIGSVYQDRGEWMRALEYYEKSLTIFEELGDKQSISYTLNNIGSVYIKEELGDKQGISTALNNIGSVYQDRGEWARALEYYEKSLSLAEELGSKEGISNVLGNIGEINIKKGDLDEAKINLEKSIAIAKELAPISTVGALANLSELWMLDDLYDDAFTILEKALQIVTHAGAKPEEIEIIEKLADTYISKYIADKEGENLSSAEKFYKKAIELARSLKMPLQEAIAIRGIGIVQAKKGDITASKKSFKKSIETLRRLGALFEVQKTSLEYARALYENNYIVEAETAAKSAAFDALRNEYREPLVKTYLLLGDIAMSHENQYGWYLDSLKEAEFNPKIYVKTCFFLVFRMKNMEKQVLRRFIRSLKEINKDKSFNNFLDALNAKTNGKDYDKAGLPSSLLQEIESFRL